ncbi:hypothetical protein GCM10009771_18640 [Nesterenkonia flava]
MVLSKWSCRSATLARAGEYGQGAATAVETATGAILEGDLSMQQLAQAATPQTAAAPALSAGGSQFGRFGIVEVP